MAGGTDYIYAGGTVIYMARGKRNDWESNGFKISPPDGCTMQET